LDAALAHLVERLVHILVLSRSSAVGTPSSTPDQAAFKPCGRKAGG
jgi:hypothetical protein